jgi:hypothetical protein
MLAPLPASGKNIPLYYFKCLRLPVVEQMIAAPKLLVTSIHVKLNCSRLRQRLQTSISTPISRIVSPTPTQAKLPGYAQIMTE